LSLNAPFLPSPVLKEFYGDFTAPIPLVLIHKILGVSFGAPVVVCL